MYIPSALTLVHVRALIELSLAACTSTIYAAWWKSRLWRGS